VDLVVLASLLGCILGCSVAAIRRFRRSRGTERLQLKWLAAGAATTAIAYLVFMASAAYLYFAHEGPRPAWTRVIEQVVPMSFVVIPAAVGVAILKHRLYDIDRIIDRALVYAALTATLTAAYLVTVAVLQGLLSPVAGRSEVARPAAAEAR
jgi:hypothetical protein